MIITILSNVSSSIPQEQKVLKVKVTQWCPILCNPMDYSLRNSLGQNTGVGSLSLLQAIFPTQGSNPGLPTWQMDSLPAELQGKSKNTGVGSLSLLQWIFLTQELDWDLLHCRCTLYQLSYEGIPHIHIHIHTVKVAQSYVTLCDPMD